ncbi:hypothetical protein MVEN_01694300 [Mycena venus]|uniref:Uncharacterized protein n=1 Tax=Mycena venus TaxID=2733690 RepID=A0A8H6XMM6_9AGAR|nr:hypothetical protein MVEN_01694300 [Mycena venus]
MSPLPSNIVPHILAGVVRNTVPGGRRQTFKWWSSSDPAQFYHCASDLLPLPVNWGQAAAAVISSEPLISYLALHRTPPRTPSTPQFGAISSSGMSRYSFGLLTDPRLNRAVDFLPCPAPHPAENAVHATIRSRDFVRAVDFLPCPALHLAENAVHATIRLNTISNVQTAVNVLLDIAVGASYGYLLSSILCIHVVHVDNCMNTFVFTLFSPSDV